MIYHVVTYSGPIGFIKPASAVRDAETYSQRFLTPASIEGMRQKLDVKAILDYRLNASHLAPMQETTQSPGLKFKRGFARDTSVLTRHVLINPVLQLAFASEEDAEKAMAQHLCLIRNEDVILPRRCRTMAAEDFEREPGFSSRADTGNVIVGVNRYTNQLDRGEIIYIPSDG